jgi:tetratricopeptide (TPR) repeat protein
MDKNVQTLREDLANAESNIRLIQVRKDQYILPIEIPLELIAAERKWEEKIADLKAKLDMPQQSDTEQSNEVKFPIFSVPFHRNPNFTGREDVLATLTQNLPTGNSTVLVQTMAGLGGVGKTQSAVEFAYRHTADYDLVWWIRTESDELFTADYATLVSRLNLPVKTAVDKNILLNLVRGWLAATAHCWLLIFDNAETAEQLQDVLPARGNGHVIITSRNPNWRHLGNVLQLNELSLAEASAFLIKRTGDANQTAAEQVAELLGKLPLALEQAAAFMSERGMPFHTYATLYIERWKELWQRTTPPRNYPATVLTTWEIAFQQIQQANPAAAHLLNLCAFLAPDNISITMIRAGATCLSPTLQVALESPLEAEEMLATLYRYSLISRKEETVTIHRLVQEVTQDRLHEEERKRWLEAAIHLINHVFPFDQYKLETWSASGAILPHLTVVVNHAEKQQTELQLVAMLWQKAARYLREQGEYAKAQSATEQALNIRTTFFGEKHLVTTESFDFLGQLRHEQADYQKAKLYYECALQIRQRELRQEHEDVAMSLNNLGTWLKDQGEYEQARSYHEQALTIRQQVLGNNHPHTAASLNNLGKLFQAQGEYEQARSYHEQTLTVCRQVLGNNHPDTAASLNNLGTLFRAQGEYEQARSYYEQALTICRQVLGNNHPHTAASLNIGLLKKGEKNKSKS